MSIPAQYNRHPLQAFGLAVVVELILLATVAAILTGVSETKSALSEPMPIVLENAEPLSLKPPEPKPPQPKPKPQIPPPQQVRQTPPPLPPQDVPAPQVSEPTSFTEPVPPPPAPPPAANTDKEKTIAEYALKVHAAVQAAHYYPPAAVALRYAGRVRVEFHLRDAVPGGARLLVASGFGLIDRAALQAVQNAHYPEPPPELRGNDLIYQVWVEFNR